MRAPCYQCPDRHTLCHMTCPRYLEYRKERDRLSLERQATHENWMNETKEKQYRKKLNRYKRDH